jgi:hypothetical protein
MHDERTQTCILGRVFTMQILRYLALRCTARTMCLLNCRFMLPFQPQDTGPIRQHMAEELWRGKLLTRVCCGEDPCDCRCSVNTDEVGSATDTMDKLLDALDVEDQPTGPSHDHIDLTGKASGDGLQ